MPKYELAEYATLRNVPFERSELASLRAIAPSIAVSPSVERADAYDLTPGSYVGAVSLEDIALTIRPKFPMRNVFFLISYATDPRGWRDDDFDFDRDSLLVDTMARGFLRNVRRSIRRGLLHGYLSVEEALKTIRGRIDFSALITRRFTRYPPIDVSYDEYSVDIEENRLIRAAIHRLLALRPRSLGLVAELRALDGVFDDVNPPSYARGQIPQIEFTRLNEHYRSSVVLSRLILEASSIDLLHGNIHASSMLIDMNEVFEDFVVVALREELKLDSQTFRQGSRGAVLRLDRNRLIKLEPDLSWWRDGRCIFVGDAKYKRTTALGIKHPDLYQMLAYSIAARVSSGLLVYAQGEADEVTHDVENACKSLLVRTLDLSQSPDVLLGQISELANLVRHLVNESSHAESLGPRANVA